MTVNSATSAAALPAAAAADTQKADDLLKQFKQALDNAWSALTLEQMDIESSIPKQKELWTADQRACHQACIERCTFHAGMQDLYYSLSKKPVDAKAVLENEKKIREAMCEFITYGPRYTD